MALKCPFLSHFLLFFSPCHPNPLVRDSATLTMHPFVWIKSLSFLSKYPYVKSFLQLWKKFQMPGCKRQASHPGRGREDQDSLWSCYRKDIWWEKRRYVLEKCFFMVNIISSLGISFLMSLIIFTVSLTSASCIQSFSGKCHFAQSIVIIMLMILPAKILAIPPLFLVGKIKKQHWVII